MSEQTPRFYEFDAFRVDSLKRLLLRTDEPVPLPPKAFDTLLTLIQSHGRVLNKDELMEAVWPDTTVEENNLTQNISAIRKALGERRGEHLYVVTVPGRGYRFVADVREPPSNGSLNGDGHIPAAIEPGQGHTALEESSHQAENGIRRDAIAAATPSLSRGFGRLSKPYLFALTLAISCLAALSGLWFLKKSQPSSEANASLKSIAVLPFKTLNAEESESSSIGTGMADALITKLSNLGRIAVRPTSAVIRYTDAAKDPLAAGRELGVDAVLDGYVQRTGDRLRVTVQMIRTSDGTTLWADTFDERFTDIFAMQDSISEQAASALRVRLSGEERERLQRRYTENTEAYRAFLKANYFMNKATKEGLNKGIEYYQQAISLDPNYSLAYAGLADGYLRLHTRGVPTDKTQSIVLARAAVMKAIEIDERVAYAHSILGFIAFRYDWDFPKAEREYKRARELDPAYMHTWIYFYLMTMNRFPEAEAEFKRFQEAHPLSVNDISLYYFFLHQYDRAEQELRNSLDVNSNHPPTRNNLGLVYEQKGMYKEAISEFQKAVELSGGMTGVGELGHVYAISGRKDEARRLLAEIAKRSKRVFFWANYEIAVIYAGLGEKDEAITYLERAYDEHSVGAAWLRFDPRLDTLRAEPRFQNFVRRIGLPL